MVDAEDGENVWSGPNPKKHYATSRLDKGQRVKVIRHDPGGWCMIAPPEGSFSWVRASYVDRETGALKENRIFVHVGSELNPDEFMTIQRELSNLKESETQL